MSNFTRIIVAESRDDLADLEFPCVVLVGDASEETREEGAKIVFDKVYNFRVHYLPSIVLLVL